MSKTLRRGIAAREAKALLRELGISALPVVPLQIAKELYIDIKPLPRQAQPGVSGILLPPDCTTLKLNGDVSKVESNKRIGKESNMQDWFGDTLEADVYEEAIGLGDYGKTLTVLTIDDLPEADELEEEAELEESWTPRFKR